MEKIEIKKRSEFREQIDQDRQVMKVYWRGQKDHYWPLASSFERQILQWFGGW